MENIRREKSSAVSRRLFRYSPYLLIAVSAVLIPALLALKVDAEVAVFLSDNHLEQEIIHDATTHGDQKYITRERKWSNFEGVVPEGATVNKIVLRLGWSEDVVVREEVSTSSLLRGESLTEPEQLFESTTTLETTTSTSTLEDNTVNEIVTDSLNEEDSSEESVLIEDAQEQQLQTPDVPIEEAVQTEPTEETEDTSQDEEVSIPEEIVGFEQVSFSRVYPLVSSLLTLDTESEILLGEIIPSEDSFLEVEPELIETETEIVSTTSTSTELTLPKGFLEVRYTIDGVTWHVLDTVEYKTVTSVEFLLMSVALEEIPNLVVSAQYSVSESDVYRLHFDTVRIEAEYVTIPEQVLPIEEIPNDQEPNFSNSSIKADVTSENIRAVVLERGGMLEFWYSVTQANSDEVLWQRLVGGSAIQEGAPIAIKERTIFWLDRNQETLFGYAVDSKSIFGVPYDNPEERTFRLPFKSEDDTYWYVTYGGDDTSLKFERTRNTEP